MNWHKTNIALILILCIIDVFLAITLYNTYKKTQDMVHINHYHWCVGVGHGFNPPYDNIKPFPSND